MNEKRSAAQPGSKGGEVNYLVFNHVIAGSVPQAPGERRFKATVRRHRCTFVVDKDRIVRCEWIGRIPSNKTNTWMREYIRERCRIEERLSRDDGIIRISTTLKFGKIYHVKIIGGAK